MRTRNLLVSSADRDRLLRLIDSARLDRRVPATSLDLLEGELARATIMSLGDLPGDVITMNSTVWFRDLDTGEMENYTLVFPPEADVSQNRISIFAPIGTALLGYRQRDVVEWQVPAGRRRFLITKVSQQEVPAELLV
jgi:regulator of nucleoside diphosphate kinase